MRICVVYIGEKKMSQEERENVVQGQEEEEIKLSPEEEIFNSMYVQHIQATTEHVFTQLPKVFIDGYSYVKIALTKNFVNCAKYFSRSGMSYQGCMQYENYQLREVKGIYYITASPILSFSSRKKMSRNIEVTNDIINRMVLGELTQRSALTGNLDLDLTKQKLLISYDNYSVTVYDKYVKAKILKFPLEAQQGHLFISWMPKLPFPMQFEKVSNLYIYNHTIEFDKEVVKFDINVFGGDACLIYNQNYDSVTVNMYSPDHEQQTISLASRELYLFSHRRPRTETAD
jgi:hypothetical protein